MTTEQQARDLLERMGIENAQSFTAGDLVELANLLNKPTWIPCVERMPLQIDNLAGYGMYWCFDGKTVELYKGNEYPQDDVTQISGFMLEHGYVEGITHWQHVIAPKPPAVFDVYAILKSGAAPLNGLPSNCIGVI